VPPIQAIRREAQIRHHLCEYTEHFLAFDTRELCADAQVMPIAKRDMVVLLSFEYQLVRFIKSLRITIR
jgi:hypothetical protein